MDEDEKCPPPEGAWGEDFLLTPHAFRFSPITNYLSPRVYSKELIEIIFHQPYTKGQFLVDAGIAQRKTAAEYLKALEKTGIMKSMKIGKEVLYLNVELYNLLSR